MASKGVNVPFGIPAKSVAEVCCVSAASTAAAAAAAVAATALLQRSARLLSDR
jgi:hypothetical protein